MRVNERTDERVAQYLRLYSCLFQTTVQREQEEEEQAAICPRPLTSAWIRGWLISMEE